MFSFPYRQVLELQSILPASEANVHLGRWFILIFVLSVFQLCN